MLTVLVNDGSFITKSQSPSEDRGNVTAAGCPCSSQTPVGTARPLLPMQCPSATGQVPDEAAKGEEQGDQHPASTACFEVILQKAIIGTDKYVQQLPRVLFQQRKSGSLHLNNTHCIINVYASDCCIPSALGPTQMEQETGSLSLQSLRVPKKQSYFNYEIVFIDQ